MNKLIFVSVILSSIVPSTMFASSDWSWGVSQQGTSHHSGGMGAGMMTGSGGHGSGVVKPPMGTGAMMGSGNHMNHEMKGLHMAMKQLSVADHIALMKMIKEYLISKGVDPEKYAEMREEIKEIKKETREDIKEVRKTAMDTAKTKRDEMRAKIKALRGAGKVNVQDISMTK